MASGFLPLPTPGGVPVAMTSWMKGHQARQMGDDLTHGKNHVAGVASLHSLAIHIHRHRETLRVGNFICGDKPWPNWTESVAGFTLGPLPGQFRLMRSALTHH